MNKLTITIPVPSIAYLIIFLKIILLILFFLYQIDNPGFTTLTFENFAEYKLIFFLDIFTLISSILVLIYFIELVRKETHKENIKNHLKQGELNEDD
tara:strand:- start:208 stop:498 length:291 start_codon:yes stop_codon:yes gene_type:complete